MVDIGGSVGKNGLNRPEDVHAVKYLLNRNGHLLAPYSALPEDDALTNDTLAIIARYQERVALMARPDQRVDPHGKTLRHLNLNAREDSCGEVPPLIYPLEQWAENNLRHDPVAFGATRGDGRRHAGCDLHAAPGSPVLALRAGRVLADPYTFYEGTMALEMDHGDCVARYGELGRVAVGLSVGSLVEAGQVIGYVAEIKGLPQSMLHLELFTGRTPGPLSDASNPPFRRRGDLLNPTSFMETAVLAPERRGDDPDRARAAGR